MNVKINLPQYISIKGYCVVIIPLSFIYEIIYIYIYISRLEWLDESDLEEIGLLPRVVVNGDEGNTDYQNTLSLRDCRR